MQNKTQNQCNDEKYLFIVNPVAQRGNSIKEWQYAREYLLNRGIPFSECISEKAGDCIDFAKKGAEEGHCSIISVGGDGTINEVVNGLRSSLENVNIGILPTGTGNDFAKSLEIPNNTLEALDIILKGKTKKTDIGRVNGKLFLNVGGVGFDAEVCNVANTSMKKLTGTSAYLVSVIKTLFNFTPTDLSLTIDDNVYNEKVWLTSVANGKYFGNGMKVAPDAELNDGLFDIVVVKETSALYFLRVFPSVFNGTHIKDESVKVIRGKKVILESPVKLTVQCDGEIIGTTPITFEVIHNGISVFCP